VPREGDFQMLRVEGRGIFLRTMGEKKMERICGEGLGRGELFEKEKLENEKKGIDPKWRK